MTLLVVKGHPYWDLFDFIFLFFPFTIRADVMDLGEEDHRGTMTSFHYGVC